MQTLCHPSVSLYPIRGTVPCDAFHGLTGRISNVYYNNSPTGGVLASSSDELTFHAEKVAEFVSFRGVGIACH